MAEKQQTIKTFDEVYTPKIEFEGESVDGKEIVGKDIIIHDFAILNGQFGEFSVIDATLLIPEKEEKRVQFLEGSRVIMGQLNKIREDKNFPIKTKIEERIGEKSKLTYRNLS